MSIIGSNVLAGASGSGVEAYEIEQSLRFDGSSYLNWTPSSAGNRRTWTWSGWVKRGPVDTTEEDIFGVQYTTGDVPSNSVRFSGSANSDQIPRFSTYLGSGKDFSARSSGVARDPAAWMHFVAVWDTTNATESERMRFYINGEQQSRYYGNSITQNTEGSFNTTSVHRFSGGSTYGRLFKGYLAETHFVDGTALDATDFGEYDDHGVWVPIKYSGSYGTNGFYLKFDPTATNGIGHDHSGNGNNWTASGFTTSGTGTDVMSDTPTNNHCTLNPLAVSTSNGTITDGNLVGTTTSSGGGNMYGTFALPSTGKWYWEVKTNSGNGGMIGIAEYDASEDFGWQISNSVFIYDYPDEGQKYVDGTGSTYGSDFTNGDLIGIACDADADTIEFYIDGTAQGSISHTIGGLFPCLNDGSGSAAGCNYTVNFGQRAFEQTPPTGYKALNTSNLPAPEIADGSANFNTVTYSGNGTSQSLTVGFQPDWIWTKPRNATGAHVLVDAVRGSSKFLESNSTGVEQTRADNDGVSSFDTNGYSIGDSADWNASSETFVSWSWLAGNGTSSNTNGSITSTVSVNATAGFSIVTYTGDGSSSATVGHGLGATPAMIITKARAGTNADNSWYCWHKDLSSGYNIRLNSANAQLDTSSASSGVIAAPTNTTTFGFTAGSNVINVNENGTTYVAYCFAEIESYSRISSYVGTNSTDGPLVHCGFKPAFILIKGRGHTSNWRIMDDQREGYNPSNDYLRPNAADTEASSNFDILSNGFKLRNTDGEVNSANTFIFAAFASHPFGGSGVSPATAR